MEFTKVILENWTPIFALVVVLLFTLSFIVKWMGKPRAEQISDMKEWLKFAVVEAEKNLGRGTGELKLRQVYDKAILVFPWITLFVSFEKFKVYVDEALEWMEQQLETNDEISAYVGRE